MIERFERWLAPTSEDSEIAHKQYILNIVLLGLTGPGLIFGLIMLVLSILGITPIAGAISGLGALPFYFLAYWLGRQGRVTLAAYIPATVVFLIMAVSSLQVGIGHVTMIGFAMVVTTAGVLIGLGAAVLFVVLSIVAYALTGYVQLQGLIPAALLPEAAIAADAIGLGLGLSVLVVLNWLANREMESALKREKLLADSLQQRSEDLEGQVAERTLGLQHRALQLQTTSEIAKLSTQVTDPDILMARAVDLIKERFGFYHTSIFMLDETGAWAELAASSGEIGQNMLAHRHRLAVGSASIIGWVTANKLPRVALDVEKDPFHFRNPLLPDTRAEMAVPLIIGQKLFGALDIQSKEPYGYTETDVRTMEAIASELAIAIDSARVQAEMRKQLGRIESAFRGQTRFSWSRLSRSGDAPVIHLSPKGEPLDAGEDDFHSIQEAVQTLAPALAEGGREIAVPIIVRGEVIATLAARKSETGEGWSPDEIVLFEAVASQAALSLENARQRAEEQRRLSELEVLNRVSQAVSQMIRLDSLYRLVHTQITQILGNIDMFIAFYHAEDETVSFPYASEGGEFIDLPILPLGEGLTSLVIRSRQPLMLVTDVERVAADLGVKQGGKIAKSWLGVPMMVGDEIVGIITLQDMHNEHRFSEDDAALINTVASQVAAAIQNNRLLDQVRRAARRERLTREIASKVRKAPDMRTILQTTARELGEALHAARTTVSLGESSKEEQLQEGAEGGGLHTSQETGSAAEELGE